MGLLKENSLMVLFLLKFQDSTKRWLSVLFSVWLVKILLEFWPFDSYSSTSLVPVHVVNAQQAVVDTFSAVCKSVTAPPKQKSKELILFNSGDPHWNLPVEGTQKCTDRNFLSSCCCYSSSCWHCYHQQLWWWLWQSYFAACRYWGNVLQGMTTKELSTMAPLH